MDYTKSNANVTHSGTGHRMHQDTAPITTMVTADDMNAVMWTLMEMQAATGTSAIDFDPDIPGSYNGIAGHLKTGRMSVTQFGAKTDGTDQTAVINAALAAAAVLSSRARHVYVPAGTYAHAGLIKVPGGVTLELGAGAVLQCMNAMATDSSIPGGAHQGQSIALVGNGARVVGAGWIDGGSHNAGGVVASGVTDIVVSGIGVRNGGASGAQAVHLVQVDTFVVSQVRVDQAQHGVQMYQAKNGLVHGCDINRVEGGIWTAACEHVAVVANKVRNCEDVGVDFEGGINCSSTGNTVYGCNNAELALFEDGTGSGIGCVSLVHRGNSVTRNPTYVKRDGTTAAVNTANGAAMWIASLSGSARQCGFIGNTVTVNAVSGHAWYISSGYGTGRQDACIASNRVLFNGVGAMFNVAGYANGLMHDANTYRVTQGVTSSATVKNMRDGSFSDNTFIVTTTPSVVLVKLYSDVTAQKTCFVARNRFYGCGELALGVDQYVSGHGTYTLAENILSTSPQVNGGLTCSANGLPIFINQRVQISEQTAGATSVVNLGGLSCLSATNDALRPVAKILFAQNRGGVQRNAYELLFMAGVIKSRDGVGSGSGAAASTSDYISSISGMTINISSTAASPNWSMFDITMNTPYQ